MNGKQKNLDHFSICACHPCAGAMLIFSVSFQFYQMSPKRRKPWSAFDVYRPDYCFCKAYGLYAATSSLFSPFFARSFSQLFFWIGSAQDFNAAPLALSSTLSAWHARHKIVVFTVWIWGSLSTCHDFSWASMLLFSVSYWQALCCAMIISPLTYMTITAAVAVHHVFRRFCEPCFHWVATRELRLITLSNPPTSAMLAALEVVSFSELTALFSLSFDLLP